MFVYPKQNINKKDFTLNDSLSNPSTKLDIFFQMFSTELLSLITEESNSYFVCNYDFNNKSRQTVVGEYEYSGGIKENL